MRWFNYDYAMRPNYEFLAFCGWIGGGLGTLYLAQTQNYPVVVIQIMLLFCCVMASWRGLAAGNRFVQSRRLVKSGLEKISARALRRRHRKKSVWLGRGFSWGSAEIQKAWDILKSAPAKIMQRSRGQWIHGLSGKDKNLRVSLDLLEGHTLIVGTTGTGKTRLFDLLIAQAIMRGERVIIIDPKGDHDLREKARLACEAYRGPESFAFFHPAFPAKSVMIDPLWNWNQPKELASRVAALIPSETEGDPFKAFGWKVLNAIIDGMVYLEKRPNLVSLRHYTELGVKNLVIKAMEKYYETNFGQDWRTKIEKEKTNLIDKGKKTKIEDLDYYIAFYNKVASFEHPETAVGGLISSYEHNHEHFQKMVASLIPILAMLTTGDLQEMLSPRRHLVEQRRILDTKMILEDNIVLYLGLDNLADPIVGSAIGSIMLADLTAVASDRYNFEKHPPKVNVFIDEAAEVVNNPAIQMLNKGRGAGFRMFVATQTLADLQVRTGTEAGARQVLGNTNNWIILRVLDGETQKYISEALPKVVTKQLDMGYRSGATAEAPGDFTGTYTESLKEAEKELIPAALLGMLPNLHYFCKLADGTTWKGRLPILKY